MRITFFFILLLNGWSINASTIDNSILNNYLDFLLELRYIEAIKYTSNWEDSTLKDNCKHLANILYYAGQKKESQLKIKSNDEKENQVILSLIKGYHLLYTDARNKDCFKHFKNAYQISKDINNKQLTKRAILSILELFTFDMSQYNKQYSSFLNEYELLIDKPLDKYWKQIYKTSFILHNRNIDVKLATEQLNEIKKTLYKIPNNNNLQANYLSFSAFIDEETNNFYEAESKYTKAINIIKNKPYQKYISYRSLIRLSEIERKKKNYELAQKYLVRAVNFIDISDTLKGKHYLHFYSSKTYFEAKKFKQAYENLKIADDLEHKINSRDNAIINSNLSIELQTAEKEKQIILQQTQLKEEKQQQKYLWIGGTTILLFTSIFGFLIYKNTKRKQRIAEQEREIEIQKTEKILKEQELTTIDAMIAGQEKERQRIASDLHDSVGATLSAARLQFEHLQKNRGKLKNEEELFTKTSALLKDAYQEVRTMAHAKNNGVIAKHGLLPAIEKLAKNVSGTNKLTIEVQDFGLSKRIDNTLEITIFRIIQELVTNIIKHANASEASISLTQHKNTLSIIVEDNGVGFNAKHFTQKEGMGLSSIEKRIEHLEGNLEIDSAIGNGTSILMDIPI